MRSSQKYRVAGGVIFIFVFVLLSVSFAAYKHSVPTGVAKFITFEHNLRRVLARAERDNFRSGVATEGGRSPIPDSFKGIAELAPSEVVVTHDRISLLEEPLLELNSSRLNLSPVLNL
jgi:hypothetical protein